MLKGTSEDAQTSSDTNTPPCYHTYFITPNMP